jgi:LysM repeat protein
MYYQRIPQRFHGTYFFPLYPTKSILASTPSQTFNGFYYIIQPGDTIYAISQTFNSPMNEIIEYNNIIAPYVIYPGQRIFIPGIPAPVPQTGGRIYIVQPGDTLFTIAENYNSSVDILSELNNIDNPDLIYPGQRIIIPASY